MNVVFCSRTNSIDERILCGSGGGEKEENQGDFNIFGLSN